MYTKDYLTFLVLLFFNFMAIAVIAFSSSIFLPELFLLIFLLILSITFMYGIFKEEEWGYVIAAFVFAVGLINTIFIYFNYVTYLIVLLVFVNSVGFIVAVTRIKNMEDTKTFFQAMFGNIDFDTNKTSRKPRPVSARRPNQETLPHFYRTHRIPITKRSEAKISMPVPSANVSTPASRKVSGASKVSDVIDLNKYYPQTDLAPQRPKHHFKEIDDFTQRIELSQELFAGIPQLHTKERKHLSKEEIEAQLLGQKTQKSRSPRDAQMQNLRKVFSELSAQVDELEHKADGLTVKRQPKFQASAPTKPQPQISSKGYNQFIHVSEINQLPKPAVRKFEPQKSQATDNLIQYYDNEDDIDDYIAGMRPLEVYDEKELNNAKDLLATKKVGSSRPDFVRKDFSSRELDDFAKELEVFEQSSKTDSSIIQNAPLQTTIQKKTLYAKPAVKQKTVYVRPVIKPINSAIKITAPKSSKPTITKTVTTVTRTKNADPKIEILYKPGKFMASEYGTKFHHPKCETAKRITKDSQVWFKNHDHAKKQGYLPCRCISAR